MTDPRVEKLADLLVDYCTDIKPKQSVLLTGTTLAEPMLSALYKKVIMKGAYPFLNPEFPDTRYQFFRYANDDQLAHIPEPYQIMFEKFDARIVLISEANTKALSNVDPDRIAKRSQAVGGLINLMLDRAAKGEMHWVGALFPTQGHAMNANMSLEEYEDFVYGACLPDMNDPIGYWKKVSAYQNKIVDWLKGRKTIHVISKETDLRMNIEGRPFINCDGKENMPDGEVFTSPLENSMNGHVYYSYPAIYNGYEVSGIRLWFENGKVIKASAERNDAFLQKMLDTDDGARYVGEWAIGTNEGITQFTGEILFDEKIGGSFHLAIGTGYPESGGLNRSAIHWDMICDMRAGGEIWVDDILFYKDGKFVIDF